MTWTQTPGARAFGRELKSFRSDDGRWRVYEMKNGCWSLQDLRTWYRRVFGSAREAQRFAETAS